MLNIQIIYKAVGKYMLLGSCTLLVIRIGFFKNKLGGRKSSLMQFGKYTRTSKKCWLCKQDGIEKDAVYYVTYKKYTEDRNKFRYGSQPLCKGHFQDYLRFCLNTMYNLIPDKVKTFYHIRHYKKFGKHLEKDMANNKEINKMIDDINRRLIKEYFYSMFMNEELTHLIPEKCSECGGDIHDKFAVVKKITEGCEDLVSLLYHIKNGTIPMNFKFGALCCECYRKKNEEYFCSLEEDESPNDDLLF